ncbi:hypothetical protein CH370_09800 [Leptospira kmetyi]|nr:hypothetical protein CH370_09800 [Leptospira kmetyi]
MKTEKVKLIINIHISAIVIMSILSLFAIINLFLSDTDAFAILLEYWLQFSLIFISFIIIILGFSMLSFENWRGVVFANIAFNAFVIFSVIGHISFIFYSVISAFYVA